MELPDELVEILRRKGCAMTVSRLADELHKAPQVIEANLGVLRRAGRVQILRPGEWELAPEKHSGPELIPPEPAAAIARAQPRQPEPTTEETTMAKTKVCTSCKERKGNTAFFKGDDECRICRGGTHQKAATAKPQGGVRKNGSNGATRFAGAIDLLKAERQQLAADLGKVDQAIAQIEALG